MDEKQQSSLTFFLPDRRVLGWVMIAKRIAFAFTLGGAAMQDWRIVSGFVILREALSAYTEYSQAKNPITTVGQSSPPNPDASIHVEAGT